MVPLDTPVADALVAPDARPTVVDMTARTTSTVDQIDHIRASPRAAFETSFMALGDGTDKAGALIVTAGKQPLACKCLLTYRRACGSCVRRLGSSG
jgi:hypothetical protein